MIKIENSNICGWEAAVRGMRNPMNSWNKSDSNFHTEDCEECGTCSHFGECSICFIGENDLELMKKLVSAGTDHSKFMRMITVTCDITAPLYW